MRTYLVKCLVMTMVISLIGYGCAQVQQATPTPVPPTPQEVRRTDAALFGYWRIIVDSSTTHFANIDPWDSEILLFRKDAVLYVQVEHIQLMRGDYDVTGAGQIKIKLYHWPAAVMFDYAISDGVLTLKSSEGVQVYKYFAPEEYAFHIA